jgi:alkylhydroperoxidase/carboxymuconolactone decarboxylase family protein YurZ
MTPEGEKELAKIRAVRGYTLPLHELMAECNPEFLRRYGDLASFALFGPAEGRSLDLKTRFLVLVGITTAVKGDREGIEWAAKRAMDNGATEKEVIEAAFLAGLPAGWPAFEGFCRAYREMKQGHGWVPQGGHGKPVQAKAAKPKTASAKAKSAAKSASKSASKTGKKASKKG